MDEEKREFTGEAASWGGGQEQLVQEAAGGKSSGMSPLVEARGGGHRKKTVADFPTPCPCTQHNKNWQCRE
jgi:hypothetical protein